MIMHFLVNDSNPNRWSLVQRNIRIIIDESEDDSETNSPFFRLFFTSKNRTQFSIAQKLKHTGTKFTFLSINWKNCGFFAILQSKSGFYVRKLK